MWRLIWFCYDLKIGKKKRNSFKNCAPVNVFQMVHTDQNDVWRQWLLPYVHSHMFTVLMETHFSPKRKMRLFLSYVLMKSLSVLCVLVYKEYFVYSSCLGLASFVTSPPILMLPLVIPFSPRGKSTIAELNQPMVH